MITIDKVKHIYNDGGVVVPGVSEILSAAGMIDLFGIPVFALQAAQKLGSAVHLACEYYDKGILKMGKLHPEIRPYLDGWIKFKKEHNIEITDIELLVHSKKWGFAGTLDRVCFIKGKRIILDLKTTTTIHPSAYVQQGGYKIAYEEQAGNKVQGRWLIQLKPGNYRIHPCKEMSDESVFISALQVYNWRKKHGCMKEVEFEREIFSL